MTQWVRITSMFNSCKSSQVTHHFRYLAGVLRLFKPNQHILLFGLAVATNVIAFYLVPLNRLASFTVPISCGVLGM